MDKKYKIIDAAITGSMAAIIFVTAITVYAQLPTNATRFWLVYLFAHHWVGKGILAYVIFLLTFVIRYLAPFGTNESGLTRKIRQLFFITILGLSVISGFFIYWFLIRI